MTNYELGKYEFNNNNYGASFDYYLKDFGKDPLCTYGIFVLIKIGFVKDLELIKKVNYRMKCDISRIIEMSNDGDNYNAIYIAGVCYERGLVVNQNISAAISCYKKCYLQNNLDAGFNLACIYQQQKKFDNAINIYKELVKKNYVEAIINLGYIKLYEKECIDIDGARKLFELGSSLNNSLAKYYLSYILINEDELKNKDLIIKLLTEASDSGNLLASTLLSKLFLFNRLFLNEKIGISILEKNLDTNYPEIIYLYAKCLELGIGIKKDKEKSDFFYRKADRLGYKK